MDYEQALILVKSYWKSSADLKCGKDNKPMKKLLNLQLFAEDPAATETKAAEGAPAQEKPTDTKEPETASKADDKSELKYSDADVNKIIDKKFAEWQKKQQKEIDEAQKLAEMNATQKAEYERDQLQKELDEYKKQASLAEMSKTARKMLSENNITISDELLSVLVSTDAEATKTAVDSFTRLFNEAVDNAVKEKARGTTPKVVVNNSDAMSEIEKRIAKYN